MALNAYPNISSDTSASCSGCDMAAIHTMLVIPPGALQRDWEAALHSSPQTKASLIYTEQIMPSRKWQRETAEKSGHFSKLNTICRLLVSYYIKTNKCFTMQPCNRSYPRHCIINKQTKKPQINRIWANKHNWVGKMPLF